MHPGQWVQLPPRRRVENQNHDKKEENRGSISGHNFGSLYLLLHHPRFNRLGVMEHSLVKISRNRSSGAANMSNDIYAQDSLDLINS